MSEVLANHSYVNVMKEVDDLVDCVERQTCYDCVVAWSLSSPRQHCLSRYSLTPSRYHFETNSNMSIHNGASRAKGRLRSDHGHFIHGSMTRADL